MEQQRIIFKKEDLGVLHLDINGVTIPKSIQAGFEQLERPRFDCGDWSIANKEIVEIQSQPLFFEWQKIDCLFVADDGSNLKPPFRFLVNGLDKKFKSHRIATQEYLNGSFQFENAVGFTDFEIKDSRDKIVFHLKTEVFPQKLDYKKDFHVMIKDITDIVYNLVFDYLQKTYSLARPKDVPSSSLIEWQAILKVLFITLERSIDLIIRKPKYQIRTINRTQEISRVKKVDKQARKWILKNQRYCSKQLDNGFRVHDKIAVTHLPERRKAITYNCFENRFVVWAIHQILARLDELQQFIKKIPSRQKAFDNEVKTLKSYSHRLRKRLNDQCFAEVESFENQWHFSTVMTMAPGYKDFYHKFLLLRKGLSIFSDDFYQIDYRDIATLYEYWCFLKIVKTLEENPDFRLESNDLIKLTGGKFKVDLKVGSPSKVSFRTQNTDDKIDLFFNRTFKAESLTFNQRPDYSIKFKKKGYNNPFWYVLDAKYRFDKYEHGNNDFNAPQDSISQLHRYRDAILHQHNPQTKSAIKNLGGVILYPYPGYEKAFESNKYFKSLNTANIGALPLMPNKDKLFKQFIQNLFSTSPETHYEQVMDYDKSEYRNLKNELNQICVIGLIKKDQNTTRKNYYLENGIYNIRFVKDVNRPIYKATYLALYCQVGQRIIGYAPISEIEILSKEAFENNKVPWLLNADRYILYRFSHFVPIDKFPNQSMLLRRGYRYSNLFALKEYIVTGDINTLELNSFSSIRQYRELKSKGMVFSIKKGSNSYWDKFGNEVFGVEFVLESGEVLTINQ